MLAQLYCIWQSFKTKLYLEFQAYEDTFLGSIFFYDMHSNPQYDYTVLVVKGGAKKIAYIFTWSIDEEIPQLLRLINMRSS